MARLIEEERARNEAAHLATYELIVVIFFLYISQIMCVMYVSLLTNTTDSSKPNVQSMCEKTGQAPLPMHVFSAIGTVSFISMVIIN